jgi:hypothetical protein
MFPKKNIQFRKDCIHFGLVGLCGLATKLSDPVFEGRNHHNY